MAKQHRKRRKRRKAHPLRIPIEDLITGRAPISDAAKKVLDPLVGDYKEKMAPFVNNLKPESAIAFLAGEHLRKQKDISLAAVASAYEIDPGTYRLLIEKLAERVSQDPLMADALSLLTSRPAAKALELWSPEILLKLN